MQDNLDPNDPVDIMKSYKGSGIEIIWKLVMTLFKESTHEWAGRTRGRPGNLHNHVDFESRDKEKSIRGNQIVPALVLKITWVKSKIYLF